MEIDNNLDLNQSQKLLLSASLVQSLNILSMTAEELENEIKRQADENPIIEIEVKHNEPDIDWEKYTKNINQKNRFDKNEIVYRDIEYDFENIVASKKNLYEYLKSQLILLKIDEKEKKVCEYLIDSIDENGYLNEETEIKEKLNIDDEIYDKCKKYIQSLEPSGVGGRNLKESLIIQLRNLGIKNMNLENIIKYDLNHIANKDMKFLCKKYGIKKNKCIEYIETIKKLNPRPCEGYNSKDIQYIKPDVIIKEVNGEFTLIENNFNHINIKINPFYQSLLQDKNSDKVAQEFIKERLDSALNLSKSIEKRRTTTVKIANSILNNQYEFFKKGIKYIRPMTMKKLSKELELHQSTISRGVNGKYMLTPFGLFEFKYFFSKCLATKEMLDEEISSISIKNFIKETIKNENKQKPLSDEKIKVLLQEKGIKIARRTVTKYREDLKILPASKRKTLIYK